MVFLPAEDVEIARIESLLSRVTVATGQDALSEHKAQRVRGSEDSRAVAAVTGESEVIAYAQAAWHRAPRLGAAGHWGVEIAVDPEAGSAVDIASLLRAVALRLPSGDPIAVWASASGVTRALRDAGYRQVRRLLRLERPLPLEGAGEARGVVHVTPFRPGRDDAAWLALNNRAFAGHPENGALRQEDLEERMRAPWFDPAGVLMAWEGDRLIGSCWTKMHAGAVGEIYIISVDPGAQGRGIGAALLVAGTERLAGTGAAEVMLYVESDNEAALGLYRRFGFTTAAESLQFVPEKGESQPKR